MRPFSLLFVIAFSLASSADKNLFAADAQTTPPRSGSSTKARQSNKPSSEVATKSIPTGSAKRTVEVNNIKIRLFTYKPKNFKDGPLFVVFHGVNRNADVYRDNAIEMADRFGALIVAPEFDEERFPTRMYQRGGLLDKDGNALPRKEWTWSFVPKIVDAVREQESKPNLPYYLIGHSAGGQFLVRFAGFMKTDAERIVAMNPGTQLFPNTDHEYPYGFGGLPAELHNDKAMKRYLAQPLTIFLGTTDTERAENLDQRPGADRQGQTRYERGKKSFSLAQKLAKRNGWEFNWTLVEADGINHTSKGMFNHKNSEKAIFGDERQKHEKK